MTPFRLVPLPIARAVMASWMSIRSRLISTCCGPLEFSKLHQVQCEAPKIAISWFISPISLWFMVLITIVTGVNLNQLSNLGGHHLVVISRSKKAQFDTHWMGLPSALLRSPSFCEAFLNGLVMIGLRDKS